MESNFSFNEFALWVFGLLFSLFLWLLFYVDYQFFRIEESLEELDRKLKDIDSKQ